MTLQLAENIPTQTAISSLQPNAAWSETNSPGVRSEAAGASFPTHPTRVLVIENGATARSGRATHMVPPPGQPMGWLRRYIEKVRSFRKLPQNWDSYGAEPPSPSAVYWAEEVLEAASLRGYRPEWVEPSAEGGVMIAFRRGTNFGSIECYNSGSIVAVLSDGHGTIEARPVECTARAINDAVSQVGEHIRG